MPSDDVPQSLAAQHYCHFAMHCSLLNSAAAWHGWRSASIFRSSPEREGGIACTSGCLEPIIVRGLRIGGDLGRSCMDMQACWRCSGRHQSVMAHLPGVKRCIQLVVALSHQTLQMDIAEAVALLLLEHIRMFAVHFIRLCRTCASRRLVRNSNGVSSAVLTMRRGPSSSQWHPRSHVSKL